MKNKIIISILVFLIALFSIIANISGIMALNSNNNYEFKSIRGDIINIYGKGIYRHMSRDVAIQGIAQDFVSLFIGIPLLLISLYLFLKGSARGKFILSGALGYFLLTYLFYTAMAMYNEMFLIYTILLSLSFFSFIILIISYDIKNIRNLYKSEKLFTFSGGFLIINSMIIALLWLTIVIPPLINGTIYPKDVEHYTTLIVQGFDLSLFLPIAFVSGILVLIKNPYGFLFVNIYLIFLSLLMSALTSKIIFMGLSGANIIPAVFIIPLINIFSIILSFLLLKNLKNKEQFT